MTDGIATGLLHAGQKIRFLSVLLPQIPIIMNGLGLASVQYLKAVIPPLCDSMAMQPTNTDMKSLSKTAADSLRVVIQVCWPRIFAYRGIIMQSLAKSWSFYLEKQDTEMMETLKHVYKTFETACDGKEKADKKALLEFKPQVFGPLFS
ncbi:hypothetical protein BY458DRAFT_497454 [Sporodiniella umbellata]|nr:hypothetical protein BY458DRAFT_497454 [Sporodiniella umbellata]